MGGIGTIECIYDMFRVLPKLYVSSIVESILIVDLLIIIHRIRLL